MKALCKECPEEPYCTEACLESLAVEHESPAERMEGKYRASARPLLSYAESRRIKKTNPIPWSPP